MSMQQALGVVESVIDEYVAEKTAKFETHKKELMASLLYEEAFSESATAIRPYVCDQIQDTRQAIAVATLLKQFLLEELISVLEIENELNLMAIEETPHPAEEEWNNIRVEDAIDAGDQLKKELKGEE